jgi:hypothetical protein
MPRELFAYRHFHEESNTAAVVTVALAEVGLTALDPNARCEELGLHSLLQRGSFREGRGILLASAIRHMRERGLPCQIFHDSVRTAALREHLIAQRPDFDFQLLADLWNPPLRMVRMESDLSEGAAMVLVAVKHALGRLPLHLLLLRRNGDLFSVMNSDTGQNHVCTSEQLSNHMQTPVRFGAVAFAGGLYAYSGISIRLG